MKREQDQTYDVAVIGGGAIGLAVAWRAAQRGLRTVVLDRGELGAGASRVAAGMLAPVTEAEFGERDLLALGLAAAAGYGAFVEELEADVGYRRCGTLAVARDADEAEALERLLAFRALARPRGRAPAPERGRAARAGACAPRAPRAARARRPRRRSRAS